MQPTSDPRMELHSSNDADDTPFPLNLLAIGMHYTCLLIVSADKATRSLGEDAVKEAITDSIVAVRHTLDSLSRHLPKDERTQREYAQTLLEPTADEERQRSHLMFDASGSTAAANDNEALPTIEGESMSPQEMRRVGDAVNAFNNDLIEQDIVNALGLVGTAVSDVRDVLLDLHDSDIEELAQITLISLRILVGYAKSAHRNLARVFDIPPLRRAVEAAHGPGDNGAGPSVSTNRGWFGEPLSADEDEEEDKEEEEAEGSEAKGGLPWKPLTPRLLQEVQRLAMEGKERPLTAAAVVAVAFPFSGAAVFVGTPVLAGDMALQWGARTPIGRVAGQTTRNAMELSKLGWVAGKLAAKQTWRLANKELDRVGGVTGMACAVGEGALWTATHPIEATMGSFGLAADAGKAAYGGAGMLSDALASVRDMMWAGGDEHGS